MRKLLFRVAHSLFFFGCVLLFFFSFLFFLVFVSCPAPLQVLVCLLLKPKEEDFLRLRDILETAENFAVFPRESHFSLLLLLFLLLLPLLLLLSFDRFSLVLLIPLVPGFLDLSFMCPSIFFNARRKSTFIFFSLLFQTERREQHFTLGKMTPIKIPEGSAPEDSKMAEFPRHRLRVLEKLGEGGFGMVSDQKKTRFLHFSLSFRYRKTRTR